MDDNETKAVKLIKENGEELHAELYLYDQSPVNTDRVQIDIVLDHQLQSFISTDYFSALLELRKIFELMNVQICCNGAARNVYPSPICLGMGVGRKAYKLEMGKKAKTADLVDIFDCEEDLNFTNIEEQRLFYENWLKSIIG